MSDIPRIDGRCQLCGWPCDSEFCSDEHWQTWMLARIVHSAMQDAVSQIRAAVEAMRPAFEQFAESMKQLHQVAVECGLVAEQPPSDPKARALWAVRNRNTGPAVHADPRRNKRNPAKRA